MYSVDWSTQRTIPFAGLDSGEMPMPAETIGRRRKERPWGVGVAGESNRRDKIP